ncbi:hypothetical protein BX666DRAFT_1110059 [Dichotomocladium elegans]|nr:hypothetical protein BX666DRAFT_1110059 [Dichotomocladium elegans]
MDLAEQLEKGNVTIQSVKEIVCLKYFLAFAERERLADDILTNRQAVIDFDRRRNSNREGFNQLKGPLQNDKKKKLIRRAPPSSKGRWRWKRWKAKIDSRALI